MVAHRLSTVRAADTIYYLDKGNLVAKGNFEYLRTNVSDFDKQAKLMGL
jgi:ATP-binding cassette subfamily C protein